MSYVYDHPVLFLGMLWSLVILAPLALWMLREAGRDSWDKTDRLRRARRRFPRGPDL